MNEFLHNANLVQAVIIALITYFGSKGVAKLTRKAQDFKTQTDGTLGAGQLALNVAERADKRLDHVERQLERFENWRRRVRDVWWPEHHRHDEQVKAELLKLDPDAVIAEAPPLPDFEESGPAAP